MAWLGRILAVWSSRIDPTGEPWCRFFEPLPPPPPMPIWWTPRVEED